MARAIVEAWGETDGRGPGAAIRGAPVRETTGLWHHSELREPSRLMGFNRRKLEDQRRKAAEKEAAKRRATDAQVLEDAERLITAWNDRQAKRMPNAVLAHNRRRHQCWLLVPVGALPGLPNDQCNRLARA